MVSTNPDKFNYIGLMNESVYTNDDKNIGDIYAINKYFLVVKRGFINIHFYYIPLSRVEGWDGNVLWLNMAEEGVKEFERDTFPNSSFYYVKDFHYVNIPSYIPKVTTIPSKYNKVNYFENNGKDENLGYRCDLCNIILDKEDDLKNHVLERHP